MKKNLSILIFLILLTLVGLWPFFKKGYFESHDGEWMVIRFSAFHQTFAAGQFPVRFVDRLNDNYGYPVLNFLYPLPFYLAEMPKLLGFGFVDSVKIIFIFSTLASTVLMYWAFAQAFNQWAALAGATVYLFIPYRFVDLYVRGSLGENLAFVFLPVIFGSLLAIAKKERKFLPILAISVAALILSHNVIAAIFLPLFLLMSLMLIREKLKIIGAFGLGIIAASFFWIPAIFDLQFVRLSQIKVSEVADHLVSFQKLFIPMWGYGPNPNGQDPLPVQIGLVAIFIFLGALYLRLSRKIKDKLVDLGLLIFIVVAVLMTTVSLPIWQLVPAVDVIQFPWRLLSLVVFITAYLGAVTVNFSRKKELVSALVILSAIISTITYTRPASFVDRSDSFYATNEDTTTVRDEYLPLWAGEKPIQRANRKIEILEGEARIENPKIRSAKYQATLDVEEKSLVQVNTIYFPGWQVRIDQEKVNIDYQNQFGLIQFKLPKGKHEVIISYTKTPVHLASELISLTSILFVGFWFYFLWRRQNS